MDAKTTKKIVFLCSGGGGNLSFVHQAIKDNWLVGAKIAGVLTDRFCTPISFAERAGLYNKIISLKDKGQKELARELNGLQPDLIITTVHKIIDKNIVFDYQDKLLNLHYSLLPAFSGLIGTKPVEAALEHHVLLGGVTVHAVTEQVDAGRPLVQGAIALQPDDTPDSLMPIVFRSGCVALLRALTASIGSPVAVNMPASLDVLGRVCLFNGGSSIPEGLANDENFWDQVQDSLAFCSEHVLDTRR